MWVWLQLIIMIAGTFRVKGVKPTDEGESSKLKIKVRLSIHGTFIIKSAVMIEKQVSPVYMTS